MLTVWSVRRQGGGGKKRVQPCAPLRICAAVEDRERLISNAEGLHMFKRRRWRWAALSQTIEEPFKHKTTPAALLPAGAIKVGGGGRSRSAAQGRKKWKGEGFYMALAWAERSGAKRNEWQSDVKYRQPFVTEWRERKGCDKGNSWQHVAFLPLVDDPFGATFADRNGGTPINLVTLKRSGKGIWALSKLRSLRSEAEAATGWELERQLIHVSEVRAIANAERVGANQSKETHRKKRL